MQVFVLLELFIYLVDESRHAEIKAAHRLRNLMISSREPKTKMATIDFSELCDTWRLCENPKFDALKLVSRKDAKYLKAREKLRTSISRPLLREAPLLSGASRAWRTSLRYSRTCPLG
jgi:hypothetical protein